MKSSFVLLCNDCLHLGRVGLTVLLLLSDADILYSIAVIRRRSEGERRMGRGRGRGEEEREESGDGEGRVKQRERERGELSADERSFRHQ